MPINLKFWEWGRNAEESSSPEVESQDHHADIPPLRDEANEGGVSESPSASPVTPTSGPDTEVRTPADEGEDNNMAQEHPDDQLSPEELLERGLMVEPNFPVGPAFTLLSGTEEEIAALEARLADQAQPGALVPFSPVAMSRLIDEVDQYALANDQGERQIRIGRKFNEIIGGRIVRETGRRQEIVRDGQSLVQQVGNVLDNGPEQMRNASLVQLSDLLELESADEEEPPDEAPPEEVPLESEQPSSEPVDADETLLEEARRIAGGA